jgi:hypothetical protein
MAKTKSNTSDQSTPATTTPVTMVSIIQPVPDGYIIAANLKQVLRNIGIALPDDSPSVVPTGGYPLYKLLFSFGVKSISDGWLLSKLTDHLSNKDVLACVDKQIGTLYKLAQAGLFMVGKNNSYEPDDSDVMVNMEHLRPLTIIHNNHKQWSTKKLDDYNGDHDKWLSWKECAKALFAQCGLYKVITDKDYAEAHPEMNAAVHGMLTISFSSSKENYMLFSTIAFEGNGHGAWENLCEFYECYVMTDIQILNITEKFKKLEVHTVEGFFPFVTEFLLYKDKLEGLYAKQLARSVVPKGQILTDWNLLFFQKLKISELDSRAENLRNEGKAIEYCVKQLLDYIVEKKLMDPVQSYAKRSGNNGKGKNEDNNTKGSHQPFHKAGGSGGSNGNGGGTDVFKLIRAETDPEAKRLLQQYADSKKTVTPKEQLPAKRPHGGGQFGGQGHGKGRPNGGKRSRRAAAAAIHAAKSSPASSNPNREDY